jgi:DNA modification methylase
VSPFYSRDGITIYCADCRHVLPGIDPATVALVIADAPYGIGLTEHGRTGRDYGVAGDHDQSLGTAVITACRQNGWPVIAFAHPMRPWPGRWRQHLVWDKGGAVGCGGDIATCWKQTWELIQVAGTGRLSGQRDNAVLRYWVTPQDCTLHICQKPVSLPAYLISKTTKPGDLILDPFMGSGSVPAAAYQLGRRCLAIEIEEAYCRVAVQRLAQRALPLTAPA